MKYFLISLLFCSPAFSQTNNTATNSVPAYVEKNTIRLAMAAHPDYDLCIRNLSQSLIDSYNLSKKIMDVQSEDANRRSLKLPPTGKSSMIPIYRSQMKNISDRVLSLRQEEYSLDKAYGIPKAEFSFAGKLLEHQR